jgi:PEP-CTERM motif
MRVIRISALILGVLILSAGAAKSDGTDSTSKSDRKDKGFGVEQSKDSFGPQWGEFIKDSKGGDQGSDKGNFVKDRDGKKFSEGDEFSPTLPGKGSTLHTFGFASTQETTPATTPEPATLLLLGSGLLGFAAFRRRRASTK